jgi:protein gp37
MAEKSKIQWTDATWNIARGCSKVDEDCKFCYMYRDGERYGYNAKKVIRTKTVFKFPLKFKETKSTMWDGKLLIFTSSLTDVFHEEIDPYRNEMWDIIRSCPHLIFQILTKRPERINECLPADWGNGWDNVWLGTSIGSEPSITRAIDLLNVKAKTRFISVEPFHGEFNFRWKYIPENWRETQGIVSEYEILKNIDWVIIGGESGNETGPYRYRPCKIEWIENLVKECQENQVPVFVKQLGTHLSKELKLTDRHGGDISEWPEHLQVREMPIKNIF